MKLSGTEKRTTLTINGKRCGVWLMRGPWIEGVDPATIKVFPKKSFFPAEFKRAPKPAIKFRLTL